MIFNKPRFMHEKTLLSFHQVRQIAKEVLGEIPVKFEPKPVSEKLVEPDTLLDEELWKKWVDHGGEG